jgi:transcriptional regulator with XRE-family HTH domain
MSSGVSAYFSSLGYIFEYMATTQADRAIGLRFQEMRRNKDLTQDELATRMRERGYKWSKATVWAVESGERPLKLAEATAALLSLGLDGYFDITDLALQAKEGGDPLEEKIGRVNDLYDKVLEMLPKLADATLDLAMSTKIREAEGDTVTQKNRVDDMLSATGMNALYADYAGELKESISRYVFAVSDSTKSGKESVDVYNVSKGYIADMLGDYAKYFYGDDADSNDDDGDGE